MLSLQALFMSNYEVRYSLLNSCTPRDVTMLMKVFGPRTRLTRREKTEYLGLYSLLFRDNNLIYDLFKSSTKITLLYKDLKELLDIFTTRIKKERNEILTLSSSFRVNTR